MENKVCFSRNVSTFSRPLAGSACCMAAHRVGGRMGDLFTPHEGRKKAMRFGRNRDNCRSAACVAPRGSRFLLLLPLVGYRSGECCDTKNARGEKTSHQRSVFSPRAKVEKSHFVLTSRGRPRGLRRSARRPWRQRRCPRRSLHLHHRGRVRRGARVARFRGRAPRERATKCAFRRR